MSGLAYNSNGVKTTYVGTKYNFNAGTSRICVRTAAGAGGVLTYPLTSDSSASQYCKIKVNINGTPCYLATQSLIQEVKNTLPTASIVEQHQGQLLLNQYTDFVFDSYSESEYTETNSVSSGTSVNKEQVTWDGSFIPDASDYYKPYTYYRYTNRVKRQVPVYKVRNNYNYSETTSYKLSVDGLGTYTSSLPYNTFGVTSESSAPVLYNQQQKQIVTNTTPKYGSLYSTNVLPPYLYTDSMTLYLRPGNQIYTTENAEYVDVYNLQNLPSNMTKIDYKEQQYVHHNKVHNEVYAEDKAISLQIQAKQTYSSEYYETFGGGIYSSTLEINDQGAPALTSRPVYDSITRHGVQIADSVSSYKSSVTVINTHNTTAYSGWYGTVTKKSLYANDPSETKILHTFAYYNSTKTKHNTDSIVSEIKKGTSTVQSTEKYAWGLYADRTSWADTETTSRRWYNNGSAVFHESDMSWSKDEKAWTYSTIYLTNIGDAEGAIAFAIFDSKGLSAYYEDTYTFKRWYTNTKGQVVSAKRTESGIVNKKTQTKSESYVAEHSWPSRTLGVKFSSTLTEYYILATAKTRAANSNRFSATVEFASEQIVVCYTDPYIVGGYGEGYDKTTFSRTTQSERLWVTGNITQKYTSNKYVSGQSSKTWDRWRTYTWGLSVSKFTDAHTYQWNEPIYSTHSSITVRAKYKKQTSDSEYTFRTSQVSEVNTYTTLSTYTTAHTYSLDTLINNVNV